MLCTAKGLANSIQNKTGEYTSLSKRFLEAPDEAQIEQLFECGSELADLRRKQEEYNLFVCLFLRGEKYSLAEAYDFLYLLKGIVNLQEQVGWNTERRQNLIDEVTQKIERAGLTEVNL